MTDLLHDITRITEAIVSAIHHIEWVRAIRVGRGL